MAPTRWRATAPDGIAHCFYRSSGLRALCGALNQPERFDHPAIVRCPDCMALESRREPAKSH